jgi:uncharacterized membrane protein
MSMNKTRLEALSDGVFSIAMTLLVLDLRIPAAADTAMLWQLLVALLPHIIIYAFSFIVLANFWISHHFLFHMGTKEMDRKLNLLNLIYLMLVAFVPFSTNLLGTYHALQPAVIIYGINILAILFFSFSMTQYVRHHDELRNTELSSRTMKQGDARFVLTVTSYLLGLIVSFFYIPLTIGFFVLPIVFNIIPGTLDAVERVFMFEFK